MTDIDDPGSISTEAGFANALAALADRADLTTRGLTRLTGIPHTSIAGYLKGKNLPRTGSDVLRKILTACGVTDEEEIERWRMALRRLWWARRHPPQPASGGALSEPLAAEPHSVALRVVVSTRPPVERLTEEPTLVGRKELLDILSRGLDQVQGPYQARVHVLHGMGGVGKSTIALALVRRARHRGVRSWWLTADNAATIAEGMQALAIELGASRELMRLGSPPDVVWDLLHRYRRPWLLVIDDADNPRRDLCPGGVPVTDGTGWVRPVEGRYGMVVITTRDGDRDVWGRHTTWLRRHRVAPLGVDDGAKVLLELAGHQAGSTDDACELAQRLGGLPLALRLAGMHLTEARRIAEPIAGPVTYAAFVRALDEGQPDVLDEAAPNHAERQVRRRIGRTWELSLDLLEARGLMHARPLLRALSCLRPAAVPYGALLHAGTLASSPLFPGLTVTSLRDTIGALADVGLIDLIRDAEAEPQMAELLMIHPLVRTTNRARVLDRVDDYLELLAELLSRVADGLDPKDPRSWSSWRLLADHCRAPLDLIGAFGREQRPAATVLAPVTLAARYLLSSGRLEQAEEVYASAIATGAVAFPIDHPYMLVLRHDRSRVRHMLGRYAEAERGFREVLQARRRVLGVRHADTLTTQHYLGRTLRELGRLDEAEELFRSTLRARRQTLGPTHSDTLTSKNNLADLMRARGAIDEGERMLLEVHEARRRLLGDEFPATLITRHHLAMVTRDRGHLDGAAGQLEELATVCVRVLGPEHPRALTVLQSLAEVRHGLGDRARAERILGDVLVIRRRVLGAEHPDTRLTATWLARVRSGE